MADLKHYGVLGMRWGKRKAQLREWGSEARKNAVNSILHPGLSDKANAESIANSPSLGTKLRRTFLFQKTSEIKDVNARTAALVALKKKTDPVYDKDGNDISSNPHKRLFKEKGQSDKDFDAEFEAEINPKPEKLVGKPVKTLFGTRTEAVYDASGKDISSKPFGRPFKKKGQSDKDYDKEIDDENSDSPDAIAKRKADDIQMDKQARIQMGVALAAAGVVTVAMYVGKKQLGDAAKASILKKYGPTMAEMIIKSRGL